MHTLSKIWLGLVAIVVIGLIALSLPYAASTWHVEKGARDLLDKGHTRQAVEHFIAALRYDAGNVRAYQLLAKAHLALDEPEKALQAIQQAATLSPGSHHVQLDMGDIYDRLGNPEQASAHYEAGLIGDRLASLLVNYVALADQLWQAGDHEGAAVIWREKLLNRADIYLYSSWRLWSFYDGLDSQEAEFFRSNLARFPEESIRLSDDSRLANYQIEAIESVINAGIWPAETQLSVLAFLAYYSDSSFTEILLRRLVETDPTDAERWYYLGEFYRRQGTWESAEQAYVETITIDPNYALPYLRRGMVEQARAGEHESADGLKAAANMYRAYQQLAPDDPLGWKKLSDVCRLENCTPNTWQNQLETYLSEREPAFRIDQVVGDRVLLGYDVDETRFVRGEPVTMWLFWQYTSAGTSIMGDDMYNLGNRSIQVVEETHNLVPQFLWQGSESVDIEHLAQVVPPLRITGFQNEFVFSRPAIELGNVIEITPSQEESDPDRDDSALQLSIWVQDNGEGNGLELQGRLLTGDENVLESSPDRIAVLSVHTHLSNPAKAAYVFIEDRTDAWEVTLKHVEGTYWRHNSVARRIRDDVFDIVMGMYWEPTSQQDVLQLQGFTVFLVPEIYETQP